MREAEMGDVGVEVLGGVAAVLADKDLKGNRRGGGVTLLLLSLYP